MDEMNGQFTPAQKKYLDGLGSKLSGRIDGIDARLGGRIDELDARLGGRIDELDARLGGKIDDIDVKLGGRIDELDAKLGGRIDELDTKVGGRIGHLEKGFLSMAAGITRTNARLDRLMEDLRLEMRQHSSQVLKMLDTAVGRMETLWRESALIPRVLDEHGAKLRDHESRLGRLEAR